MTTVSHAHPGLSRASSTATAPPNYDTVVDTRPARPGSARGASTVSLAPSYRTDASEDFHRLAAARSGGRASRAPDATAPIYEQDDEISELVQGGLVSRLPVHAYTGRRGDTARGKDDESVSELSQAASKTEMSLIDKDARKPPSMWAAHNAWTMHHIDKKIAHIQKSWCLFAFQKRLIIGSLEATHAPMRAAIHKDPQHHIDSVDASKLILRRQKDKIIAYLKGTTDSTKGSSAHGAFDEERDETNEEPRSTRPSSSRGAYSPSQTSTMIEKQATDYGSVNTSRKERNGCCGGDTEWRQRQQERKEERRKAKHERKMAKAEAKHKLQMARIESNHQRPLEGGCGCCCC